MMPYKRVGNKIYKKEAGKWQLKQTAKSADNALKALNLLHAVEHGWHPTGKKKNRRGHV